MEASQAVPAEPTTEPAVEPEEVEPAPAEPAAPDANDPWAAVNERLDGIAQRLPEPEPQQPETPDYVSMIDQLMPEYDEPEAGEAPAEPEPASQAPQDDTAALQQWINQQVQTGVQQALQPVLADQEWERRSTALNEFAEQHKDIKDPQMVDRIKHELQPLAQRYGEGVFTDPALVKQTYYAIRAAAVAASQTPAEAVGSGATLETNAGPSGGEDQASVQEQITQRLIGSEGPQDGVPFL